MSINYRTEALALLAASRENKSTTFEGHNPEADRLIAEAQVHATLARDEERAAEFADMRDALTLLRRREAAVRELVSAHIAKGLASRERDRWNAAIDLAKALGEADCNMERLIDARLSDDGWDPRSAWKTPASAVPTAAAADDPWTPQPKSYVAGQQYSQPVETALQNLSLAGHVTPGDTLNAAIPVIAGHIAEALTNGENDHARTWARSITDELKRIGLDLRGRIEQRAEDLRGGKPFSYDNASPLGYSDEPPF